MNNKHHTIVEHKSLFISKSGRCEPTNGNLGIPPKLFSDIKNYVYENSHDATLFLTPSYSKQLGDTLKAQQFVGVIETRSGITIEILPKIANEEFPEIRKIFLKMLKSLKKSPFKHFDFASLNTQRMHLLEIFISLFCDELSTLIKKGVKSDYLSVSENSQYLKGKLLISDHMRKNTVHRERFFIQFDEYSRNRIENRIIRSTLNFLNSKSKNNSNQKRLKEFLFIFDDVNEITINNSTFSQLNSGRQLKHYDSVLNLCKIFLSSKSITPFTGSNIAFALLFDMNQVFEDYVAACLRKHHPEKNIKTQVGTKYLIESPRQEFKLKPDMLIDDTIIADTKWKILDSSYNHNGISQSDIYQMYAYGKKYDRTEIHLIYPYTSKFPYENVKEFKFDNSTTLKIMAFDCKRGKMCDSLSTHGNEID